jgi:hypothetical protein
VSPLEAANAAFAVADVLILPAALVAVAGVWRGFEPENPARRPWALLGGGLCGFWIGEVVEASWTARGLVAPFPSAADAFFLVGYPLFVAAFFLFLRAYLLSGMADGLGRLLVAAAAVVIVLGAPALMAVTRAAIPPAERLVGGAYVVLDLLALAPLLVLVRLALRMRGGRVWQVWFSLLLGFALTFVGDLLVAYGSAQAGRADESSSLTLDLASSVVFTGSYLAIARGARRQRDLLG